MIETVHVDEHLLVVNKPAGLLAVPGRGEAGRESLASRVALAFPDARVVHRLDMDTSGLMLFARGAAMQRRLARAFAERTVDKGYVAIVAGLLADNAGRVDAPIAADWPNRPRRIVDASGQPSLTHWRVLERSAQGAPCTRVALVPHTGRTHQLRVHLAFIGHPIVGDRLYAPQHAAARLMLHAHRLAFAHPATGKPLVFEIGVPF
jgi:tRNA pseudouridine32 synthase/23S rRNA pseudouridine746 synthase